MWRYSPRDPQRFFFWNVTFFQVKSTSNLKPDGGKTFNLSRPKARHLNWSKPCLLQIRTLVGWNLHWRTLKSYRQGSGPQGWTSRFGHPNRYYSPLGTLNWIRHAQLTTSPVDPQRYLNQHSLLCVTWHNL
jgi:hypothetical protein